MLTLCQQRRAENTEREYKQVKPFQEWESRQTEPKLSESCDQGEEQNKL